MNEFNNRNYTPQQVADQLGFKVASIYALLSRHELAALKVGRNRVITQEQLNAYLAHRRSTDAVIDYTKTEVTLWSGACTLQGSDNPHLHTNSKGKWIPVAIKPSRQFEKKKPISTEKQLELAKIRKLNADTAKEVQETQAAVFSMYGPNKASKGL